jgi:hypothetical protein
MTDGHPQRPRRMFSHAARTLDPDLEGVLDDLRADVARRRLNVFRQHAARRVRLASPLLLDACWSDELDQASWRLRPTPRWPTVPTVQTFVRDPSHVPVRSCVPSRNAEQSGPARFPFEHDVILLRVSHRSAHMVLRNGDAAMHTADFGGRLCLPWLLASDRCAAFVGGPLDRAFPHPAAYSKDYVVQSATPDVARMRTVLMFTASPIEWRMPWARPPVQIFF